MPLDFITKFCPNRHPIEVPQKQNDLDKLTGEFYCDQCYMPYKYNQLLDSLTPKNLEGVGPDAPITVNEHGGKESATPYRFDLLPPYACAEVAKILAHGAEKYGEWNWLKLEPHTSLNHALQHIFAYIVGDNSEGDPTEHARHAACRILFWLDLLERKNITNVSS